MGKGILISGTNWYDIESVMSNGVIKSAPIRFGVIMHNSDLDEWAERYGPIAHQKMEEIKFDGKYNMLHAIVADEKNVDSIMPEICERLGLKYKTYDLNKALVASP